MRDAIHTETLDGFRIQIFHDEDCSSPREYDNLGTIATWHRRYKLGDVQPCEDPQDYRASLPKGSIILPVYMYEHGGIALSTSGFSDPWDSGQLGYISATPDQIRVCFMVKRITAKVRQQAEVSLRAELEEYGRFVSGECYGYVITREPDDDDDDDRDLEKLDSCWGFIGYEYVQEQAREAVKYLATQRDAKQRAELDAHDQA